MGNGTGSTPPEPDRKWRRPLSPPAGAAPAASPLPVLAHRMAPRHFAQGDDPLEPPGPAAPAKPNPRLAAPAKPNRLGAPTNLGLRLGAPAET